MGLKTTNYEIKELGITLPTAYAIIHELRVFGNDGVATLHIQSTRENALNMKPIATRIVRFSWERETNPLATAYTEAKAMKYEKTFDEETQTLIDVEAPNPFYGWEDDIQE